MTISTINAGGVSCKTSSDSAAGLTENNCDIIQNAKPINILLKALANEKRMGILCHLARGEHTVSELEKLVDLSQSALSQHLAKLRGDELVKTRRVAQNIHYSIDSEDIIAIMECLQDRFGK